MCSCGTSTTCKTVCSESPDSDSPCGVGKACVRPAGYHTPIHRTSAPSSQAWGPDSEVHSLVQPNPCPTPASVTRRTSSCVQVEGHEEAPLSMIPSASNYLRRASYIGTGIHEKAFLSEGLQTMDFQSAQRILGGLTQNMSGKTCLLIPKLAQSNHGDTFWVHTNVRCCKAVVFLCVFCTQAKGGPQGRA